MIFHTMVGTNDFEKAESFYCSILALIGGTQIHKSSGVAFWEFEEGSARFALTVPFDGEAASYENGAMIALSLSSCDKVQEVFAMAIRLGASSEGQPGERNNGAYYGAYFRDLDGNKIAIFHR